MRTNNEYAEIAESINNGIEHDEKVKRIAEIFRMMFKLESFIDPNGKVKSNIIFTKTVFIPKYLHLTTQRLSKMFKWLSDNFVSYRGSFPAIPDFENAKRNTADYSPNTFEDENKRIDNEVIPYDDPKVKAIFESFRDKFKPKGNGTRNHSQVQLIKRMNAENKVYSVKLGRWVSREEAKHIGGIIQDYTWKGK